MHGWKGGVEKEKRHPSDRFFSVCHSGYTLTARARKVWGRIRFTFAVYPTLLVTTFENWERATVYQKKIETINYVCTFNIKSTIDSYSLFPICTIFDSRDVLNSSLRSIYKAGRKKTRICSINFLKFFSSCPMAPFSPHVLPLQFSAPFSPGQYIKCNRHFINVYIYMIWRCSSW